MDSAKMCGFLLLTLLGGPAGACMCFPTHPQAAYCSADVVFRAKFVGVSKQTGGHTIRPLWTVRYEIKITKVHKGSEKMQGVHFLFTPAMESMCGYKYEDSFNGEEYVIAGMLQNKGVFISLCSFIKPWAWLSPAQQQGLSMGYSKGCNCKIKPCTNGPCSTTSNSQCLWTDAAVSRIWNGFQAKSLACLPKSEITNLCTWQALSTWGPESL